MKNLILTFILIILTICLVKQMNMKVFNQTDNFEGIQGCGITSLANPSPDDYYNCLMKQTNSLFTEMEKMGEMETIDDEVPVPPLSGEMQSKYMNKIMIQIRNYFISLYINNLEKHYTGIIIIRPSDNMISRDSKTYIHRAKPMNFFMTNDHRDGTIYKMKIDSKTNAPQIETVSDLEIPNMGGILVSTGYSLGISMPDKNKSGDKCRLEQYRPEHSTGNCIPKDLKKYNEYLKGGKFYNLAELLVYYIKTTEAQRYYTPTTGIQKYVAERYFGSNWRSHYPVPLRSRPQTIVRQRNWIGLMRSYNAVMGRKDANPGSFNYHTDTHGYSSCWDRGTASCHYAYGINLFKHLNIIPQVDFFNEFYANPEKRAEHRARFKNGDFSKLDPYFNF